MVLSTMNHGKYLSARWHRDRQSALEDPTACTAEELAYYEVDAFPRLPCAMDNEIETTPLDPSTEPKTMDLRGPEDR
jgi:hypothetical protein